MSITSENAEQLFERITNPKHRADNQIDIDGRLFPNAIAKSNICEVCGESGSGKSDILLHLITRCLLPSRWYLNNEQAYIDLSQHSCFPESKSTDGHRNKIILIDTDGKFSILKLFNMLELRVKSSIRRYMNQGEVEKKQIEDFIRECMKNLLIYNCFTNEQFLATLAACEHMIKTEQRKQPNNLKLLFIDSINSNFDYLDKFLFNDQFYTEKYTVAIIKRMVEHLNMAVIATRCGYDTPKSYLKWQSIVTKRICLNKCLTDDQMKIVHLV
jgi:DNA-repair protein XRCC2